MRLLAAAAVAAIAASLTSCAPKRPAESPPPSAPARLELRPLSFRDLPGWLDDDLSQAIVPFLVSCATLPPAGPGDPPGPASPDQPGRWAAACEAATRVPAGDRAAARNFWESRFQPFQALDAAADGAGLFTGYYEPEVAGSRTRAGRYMTPLLARPADVVQVDLGLFDPDLNGRRITGRIGGGAFLPYWDRAAIEAGALRGRGLERFFLADPVDAFVLQIQGSGRVRLPDGRVVRVSYDGQNGRPYVPIGRVLARRGDIAAGQVTMQSIRAWLAAHPEQAAATMDENPSFVFFREVTGLAASDGPPGALGAKLTAGRSIAVDRKFVPLGTPVFVDTVDPLTGKPFRRLMQAQDTGGAIRGPVRADVFWGFGADAEARAGLMQAQGSDYLLVPR